MRMPRLSERGQFIPISAMVMFTTVVFLVAVLNVYKVSRAKLQIQNLADAAALNVASQMASSLNKVADLNQWMNNMLAGQTTKPGDVPNCANVYQDYPPIACAENPTKSSHLNRFSLKGNAAAYALIVQKVNQTQQLFVDTYNNFIGAGSRTMGASTAHGSLESILLADIPELGDPGTKVVVWNTNSSKPQLPNLKAIAPPTAATAASSLDASGMQPLKFKIHEVTVTYKTVVPFVNIPGPDVAKTLTQLISNNSGATPVGWMEQDPNQPSINVGAGGSPKSRIGAGVMVIRQVKLPFLLGKAVTVTSQATAYVVEGSGMMGSQADMQPDPSTGALRPVFKPTYWVKLAGVQ